MKAIELEAGNKTLQVEIYDGGDIEVTISAEHHGWNDGGKAIAGDIVLDRQQAIELIEFFGHRPSIMDEVEQMLPLTLENQVMTRATIFFSNAHKRWIIRSDCRVGRLGDFFAPGKNEPTDEELRELFGQDIEISRMSQGEPKVVTNFDLDGKPTEQG